MLFHRLLQKILRSVSFGVFLHFLLKYKPFDDFSSFQDVIANLFLSVATEYVCVCVCIHWIKTSFKLSLHFFSAPSLKDGRMGRFRGFSSIYVEVKTLMLEFVNRLKNGTHLSCCERLPKGHSVQMSLCLTSHKMLWHTMVGDMWWPECVQPSLPKEKSPLAAEIKSLFGDSCLTKICLLRFTSYWSSLL